MAFDICVYVHNDGHVPFYEWVDKKVPKAQRIKLTRQLDRLHLNGEVLRNDPLADCGVNGLSKLKVRGNLQLRPLLCVFYGDNYHINKNDLCYVFLVGAFEKDSKYVPDNAREIALNYKKNICDDYLNRKIKHELY